MAVLCMECGSKTVRVRGSVIYPHRRDLHRKWFYKCKCGAYCGCHNGTVAPLGLPCGPETRAARMDAHAAFDRLWRSGEMSRSEAYRWLAGVLGLSLDDCHIGKMNKAQALAVVAAVREKL